MTRITESRLTERSLAPDVHRTLQTIGYTLQDNDNNIDNETGIDSPRDCPGVWLVDEDRLDELPDIEAAPYARVLMISPPRLRRPKDSRIVATLNRPARLSEVYAFLQDTVAHQSRRSPRIRTSLSARCLRADRRSVGALLSLSEGGCLLQTRESLQRGVGLDLQFALPEYGLFSVRAECRHVRESGAGLAFWEPTADILRSIESFVMMQIADRGSACLA